MPRIKAALALLATAVFCIGFNAIRYPVVWRMVAAPPEDATKPVTIARASPGSNPAAAIQSETATSSPTTFPAAIHGGKSKTTASDAQADALTASDSSRSDLSKAKPEANQSKYGLKRYTPSADEATEDHRADHDSGPWGETAHDMKEDRLSATDEPGGSTGLMQPEDSSGDSTSGKKVDSPQRRTSGVAAKKKKPSPGAKTTARSEAKKKVEASDTKKPWETDDGSDKPVCAGGVCTLPASGLPDSPSSTMVPVVSSPSPSEGGLAGPGGHGGWSNEAGYAGTMLPGSSELAPETSSRSPVPGVRHLPPVEQTASTTESELGLTGEEPIPVYPATHPK
jgi:hypothetical protein